jgi:hypothetical protein
MGKHSRTHISEEEADQLLKGIRALKDKKKEQKAEQNEVHSYLRDMRAAEVKTQEGGSAVLNIRRPSLKAPLFREEMNL